MRKMMKFALFFALVMTVSSLVLAETLTDVAATIEQQEPAAVETVEPQATPTSELPVVHEITEEPEMSVEPEATAEPETTEEPAVIPVPAVTEVPETSAESQMTEIPEVSVEPQTAETPAPSITPEPSQEDGNVEIEGYDTSLGLTDPMEESLFTANVKVWLEHEGDIYYGDYVTLHASISEASAAYTVRWEVSKDSMTWRKVWDGEMYTFQVTKDNANDFYRAVAVETVIKIDAEMPVEGNEDRFSAQQGL